MANRLFNLGVPLKRNPLATPTSIARHAIYGTVGATVLWFAAVHFRFNPAFQPSWPFGILFVACGAFGAAVIEWQLPPHWDQ